MTRTDKNIIRIECLYTNEYTRLNGHIIFRNSNEYVDIAGSAQGIDLHRGREKEQLDHP